MAERSEGPTAALARHVAELRFDALPEHVVAKARNVILDALGCQVACSTIPHCRMAIEYAREQAGPSHATVIGTDFKTGVEHAALVNGILGHGDEIDEALELFGHASAVLVPAVLAVGEREGATGKDMITALVAGYDVAGRLGKAGLSLQLLAPRNFQQGSTAGSMAAAAVAGSLLGLSQVELQAAFGLGAEQACGLQAMRVEDQHMNKSLHMGVGSRNGIASAYLARHGYGSGVLHIFEPPYSVFQAFIPGEEQPEELTRELGERYEVLVSSPKRYSAGRPTHAAIESLFLIMRREGLSAADLDAILVRLPVQEHGLLSRSKTMNINLEYIIAVAAMDGRVTWEQYEEERQADPALRALWERVSSEGSEELEEIKKARIGSRPAEVVLTTRDGRSFTERVLYPPGHPENPMSQEELDEKYRYWSTRVLPEAQSRELMRVVKRLEDLDDVNTLGELLRI